jgi:transcriptional regulator with XRE-family HTH domain
MRDSPTVHDPGELRERRILAGLNQDDLASLTRLTQSYISLLERGQREPTAKTLKVIADALDCKIGDLMRKRDRRRPKSAVASVPRASAGRAA